MAEATGIEYSDDDDEGREGSEEEGEDSDDSDEELDEEQEEEESDEEEERLPRDLAGVPCCSREVDDGWMRPREGEVRRCVVIDGANIVHAGSAYSKERRDPMLNISSLLAWIRFFLVNDFEVVTVLPQRYLRKTLVLHTDILKTLNHCGLLFVPHSLGHISDDYIVLELARECEGVVLSVDQYRDQCRLHPGIARVARDQRVAPAFHERSELLEEEEWFHRTRDGRHWLAYHTLAFADRRTAAGEEEWRGTVLLLMIQVGDTRRVAQADGRGFSKLGMEESEVESRPPVASARMENTKNEYGGVRQILLDARAPHSRAGGGAAEPMEWRDEGEEDGAGRQRDSAADTTAARLQGRTFELVTEVITRAEMATQLREQAEKEERRARQRAEAEERAALRRARMKAEKWMDTIDN
ncbi:rde-8 [Pristionchus pacificus]|uniref:Rde-8 n=1 Tax=Pristionchus pacificus TaxID=54126 RepID=A0A2A6CD29_PRIPA|nr:rde-8 [Pristionchus pacificus]|eukprot:PDM76026.1 rde-8 [Pristionchus pacificus]